MIEKAVEGSKKVGVRAISLFSGCGGSDLALAGRGYDVVWANDVCEPACRTYESNLGSGRIECGDIAKYDKFPAAELLIGCYPCQGYTQGGKRDWEAPVNFLYRQFDRALRTVKPVAFVVENVNGMAYGESRGLLDNQLRRYRLAGYRVKWAVLNARDYGVPQNRRRVFLVGVKSSLDFDYNFPVPTHGAAKPLA
ncbi:MAG: DNA (cytosine-5-)-methyltransferase, partial [Terracidiphilus sp.]